MLKKILITFFSFSIFLLTSCENLLTKQTNSDLVFNFSPTVARDIKDAINNKEIKDDTVLNVKISYEGIDKESDSFEIKLNELHTKSILLKDIPFDKEFSLFLEVMFNDLVVYTGESNKVTLKYDNPNIIIDIDITEKRSNIEYENNGGIVEEDKRIIKEYFIQDLIKASDLPSPSKEGFYFDGWYYDEECTKKVELLGKDNYIGDVKLFAKWNEILTSIDNQDSLVDFSSNITISSNYPTAEIYYTLDGSVPSKSSLKYTDKIVIDDSVIANGDSFTVKAISFINGGRSKEVSKSFNLKRYELSFNKGSYGEDKESIKNLKNGDKVSFDSLPLLEHEKQHFIGWEHNGKLLEKGDEVLITGNIELIACWEGVVEPVTFSAPRGEIDYKELVSLSSATVGASIYYSIDDQSYVLYENPIEITKETNIKAYGTKKGMYNSVTTSSSYTIKSSYTVTFNEKGHGVQPKALSNLKRGDSITSPSPLTDTGYIFKDWYKDEEYKEVFDFSVTKMGTQSITLYAKWEPITYTVKFNVNGGSGSVSEITATYDKPFSLPSYSDNKTGYKSLNMWTTQKDSGTSYAASASCSANLTTTNKDTVILYAKWEPITYTVQFDVNGGSGSVNEITATYDKPFNLPSYSNNKSGYTSLNKWSTQKDGGSSYAASSSCSTNLTTTDKDTVILYAMWRNDAPPSISNLKAIRCDGGMDLSWSNPSVGDIKTIEISYGSSKKSASGQNIRITGLNNSASYTFKVRVIDNGGLSSSEVSTTKNAMINLDGYQTPSWSGDTATFGVWPQTLLTDNSVIESTNTAKINGLTVYFGTDGQYYVKEKGKNPSNSNGNQFNDKSTKVENNKDYYFKVEPLKWKTVNSGDSSKTLVASEKVITGYQYGPSTTNWENSSLRSYLNGEFINGAFSANGKNKIVEAKIVTKPEKVFAMCQSDYNNYYTDKDSRVFYVTDYALGTKQIPQYTGMIKTTDVWTRTEGSNSRTAAADAFFVTHDGQNNNKKAVETWLGVQPSIWISK